MTVKPIQEIGGSRTATVNMSYNDLIKTIGFRPNATKLDDSYKVKASWGFIDSKKRKGFVWSYYHFGPLKDCFSWSADGDHTLLTELFGVNVSFS